MDIHTSQIITKVLYLDKIFDKFPHLPENVAHFNEPNFFGKVARCVKYNDNLVICKNVVIGKHLHVKNEDSIKEYTVMIIYRNNFSNLQKIEIDLWYQSSCVNLRAINEGDKMFSLVITIITLNNKAPLKLQKMLSLSIHVIKSGNGGKQLKLPFVLYNPAFKTKLVQDIMNELSLSLHCDNGILDTHEHKLHEYIIWFIMILSDMVDLNSDTLRNKCVLIASKKDDLKYDNVPKHIAQEIEHFRNQRIVDYS